MAMTAPPTILAGVVQMLLSAAGRAGLDRRALLQDAGVDELQIADRDAHVPLAVQQRIGMAIMVRLPGRSLACMVAEVANPTSFGALGQVVRHSATLRQALGAFCQYHRLLVDSVTFTMSPLSGGQRLTVEVPAVLAQMIHPVEAMLASFVMLGRRLTGVDWQPLAIELQHAPLGDGRELDALLAEPVRYRAERNALSLSNATLALPIAGARPDRHALFVAHADSLMQERVRRGDVSGRVSALLASELPHGLGRQNDVAQRLSMSSRTLSRRLKQEGTTFGELLDETRRELSLCYLRDASLAVYEVAFLLGYSEPSTFFRAFKRWTGETPQSWRGACA